MRDLLSGLRLTELASGVVPGVAAALVCLACWAWRRRHTETPAPVAGLALAAAGLAGVAAIAVAQTVVLAVGLLVLAVAGTALACIGTGATGTRWLALAIAGVLLPAGAVLTVWRADPEMGAPVRLGLALSVCVAGLLLFDFDRRWHRRGLALPLLAVSAAGIYATVPDVEAPLAVLGVTLPIALLGCLPQPPSLGPVGTPAAAGLLVWTIAVGGAGRPGSIAGGLACLGVLAVEPVARRLDSDGRSPLDRLGPHLLATWPVLAVQLVLAGVAARIVGRPEALSTALLLGALELAAALAAAVAITRWRRGRKA